MADNEELAQIVRTEVTNALEEVFGPLLLNIAKMLRDVAVDVKTIHSGLNDVRASVENQPMGSPSPTGFEDLKSWLVENLISRISVAPAAVQAVARTTQVATADEEEEDEGDIALQGALDKALKDLRWDEEEEEEPVTPSPQLTLLMAAQPTHASVDTSNITEALQSDIRGVTEEIQTQFAKIDKTLGRFFQTSQKNSKEILEILNNLSENLGQLEDKVGTAASSTGRASAQPSSYSAQPSSYSTPSYSSAPSPTPKPKPKPSSKPEPQSSTPVGGTSPVSGGASSGEEKEQDLKALNDFIEFMRGAAELNPKDVSKKIEEVRDAILMERTTEAPYRGQAARVLRQILSISKSEMASRMLSEGAREDIVKQVEVLIGRID